MDIDINEQHMPLLRTEKNGSALLWRKEDNNHILLARHDIYVMNKFAKEVLELCNGNTTIGEIYNTIAIKYGVEKSFVIAEVQKLIKFTLEKNLITLDGGS